MHTLCLEMIVAAYPLLLVAITYIAIELHARDVRLVVICWRPFHKCCVRLRRSIDPHSSVINAFATIVILYLHKILYLSVTSLIAVDVIVYNETQLIYEMGKSFKIEPSLSLTSSYFFPTLLAFLIINLLLFGLFPLLFLCLYPSKLCHRFLRYVRLDRPSISMLMDVFQGYFKNGTGNSRDFRALSGLYIFLEIFLVALYQYKGTHIFDRFSSVDVCVPLLTLIVAIIFCSCRPFKQNRHNFVACFNLFLACGVTSGFLIGLPANVHLDSQKIIVNILFVILILPHIALFSFGLYRIARSVCVFSRRCIHRGTYNSLEDIP